VTQGRTLEEAAVPGPRARSQSALWRPVGYYVICVLVTMVVLAPVVLVVGSSFKSSTALFAVPPSIFPSSPTLASYRALFDTTPFLRNIANSVVIGVVVSAVAVIIGTAAGYVIAREKFRGRSVIRIGSLVWYMFPPMLIMIPLYLEFAHVGLVNNDLGVSLAFLTFTIPFSVWMMTAFFQQVPYELDEAAWLDGATKFGTLWRVALPVARTGMAACFVTAFMMTWGDYLFSITLLSSGSTYTVGAGLNSLIGTVGIAYGQLLAGTVIVLIVPIGILAVGRKWFTRGLVSGAVK
jgi:multiple sugar transport system permease protein